MNRAAALALEGSRAPPADAEPRLGDAAPPWWFRALTALVAALPYRATAPLGRALGFLAGSVLRVRRAHVVAAIARAGLDRPARLASRVYASLGRGVFELLWFAGRPAKALDPLFEMEEASARAILESLELGRGLVVATAHSGNWDLNACAAARWLADHGVPGALTVVTKRLSIRSLDRGWQRLRADRGVELVEPKGAARAVARSLARGSVVALLVDQAPPSDRARATSSMFLGAPARHDLAPALLAARAGAPIAMLFGYRDASGRHHLACSGVIQPEAFEGGRAAIARATERIAAELDAFVRLHPEQWLWLHRRWK